MLSHFAGRCAAGRGEGLSEDFRQNLVINVPFLTIYSLEAIRRIRQRQEAACVCLRQRKGEADYAYWR